MQLSGTTAIALGTTGTLTAGWAGNTSTGAVTITANAPNLNVGTYELYAVFNPSTGTLYNGVSRASHADGDYASAERHCYQHHLHRRVLWRHLHIHDNCNRHGSTCSGRTNSQLHRDWGQTGTETTNAAGQATFPYAGSFGIVHDHCKLPSTGRLRCFQQQHHRILLHHLRFGAHGFSHRV